MPAFEIPLSPEAQTFQIQLAGTDYNCRLFWNLASNCWILDIGDSAGLPLVRGIPVVTGLNILAPYEYLGFGGQLVVQTDHALDAVPTFENLGKQGHLYFLTPDAIVVGSLVAGTIFVPPPIPL